MKRTLAFHTLIFTLIFLPTLVLGQGGINPGGGGGGGINPPTTPNQPNPIDISIPNPLDDSIGSDLMSLIVAILNRVVMPIAAVFVVFWIIYAGFKYVTARGNPAKIKDAHQTLLWSLIGAGVLLGAAGIARVVQNTINSLINN